MLSGDPVRSFPNVVFLLVGGSSPLVAGLSLLWLTSGREGYRDLRRRLTETGRIRPRWWLVIALLYPTFTLVVAAVAIAVGYTSVPLEVIEPRRLLEPGSVVSLFAVALVFPAVEEIGLRGYWFDQLQTRWSALAASLILGVVWAAWHVPLVYMVGYYDETTFQPELWWWLPSIVLTAVIGTWVYNNTRRSVLAVIGLHFVGNLTGETMGFASEMFPFVHLGTALVAVCLVVVWGPESLRGRDVSKPNAGLVEQSN
ncbi:CPBP family intramembrane glutamic endopeptidase [Natronococcus sp.]|uniref:CPBP family intramembrane glutamic endopeptidase n=1 Tax=Natronococcus sp. TaxID=35747 RepID=UPI0025F55B83|nr:CPBP family intramembrane glutamic endopeptidase [Natronococcus sp.]